MESLKEIADYFVEHSVNFDYGVPTEVEYEDILSLAGALKYPYELDEAGLLASGSHWN
jgi:hypothetical protein